MKKLAFFLTFLAFAIRAQVIPLASPYSAGVLLNSTDSPSFLLNSGTTAAIQAATNGLGGSSSDISNNGGLGTNIAFFGTTLFNNSNLSFYVSTSSVAIPPSGPTIVVSGAGDNNANGTYSTNGNGSLPGYTSFPGYGILINNSNPNYTLFWTTYWNVSSNYSGGASGHVIYITTNAPQSPNYGAVYSTTNQGGGISASGTNPCPLLTFYTNGISSSDSYFTNVINSQYPVFFQSTNGAFISGNVDSAVGFTVNGQPIITTNGVQYADGSNTNIPTPSSGVSVFTQLYVTNCAGIATNFNGIYDQSSTGYYTNETSGWCLVGPSILYGTNRTVYRSYFLVTNILNNPRGPFPVPTYGSPFLIGDWRTVSAGSPTNHPFISIYSTASSSPSGISTNMGFYPMSQNGVVAGYADQSGAIQALLDKASVSNFADVVLDLPVVNINKSLIMRSNSRLRALNPAYQIIGMTNMNDYMIVGEAQTNPNPSTVCQSNIFIENITINANKGAQTGNGSSGYYFSTNSPHGQVFTNINGSISANIIGRTNLLGSGSVMGLFMSYIKDVKMRDVTILDAPNFAFMFGSFVTNLSLVDCKAVWTTNGTISSDGFHFYAPLDGLTMMGCKSIQGLDDAIAFTPDELAPSVQGWTNGISYLGIGTNNGGGTYPYATLNVNIQKFSAPAGTYGIRFLSHTTNSNPSAWGFGSPCLFSNILLRDIDLKMWPDPLLLMSAIEANSFSIMNFPVLPIRGDNLMFENIRVNGTNNCGIDLRNFYGDNLKIRNYTANGVPITDDTVYVYIKPPMLGWGTVEISDCTVDCPITNASALVEMKYYITNVIVTGSKFSTPSGTVTNSALFFIDQPLNSASMSWSASSSVYPLTMPVGYGDNGSTKSTNINGVFGWPKPFGDAARLTYPTNYLGTNIVITESTSPSTFTLTATGGSFNIRTNASGTGGSGGSSAQEYFFMLSTNVAETNFCGSTLANNPFAITVTNNGTFQFVADIKGAGGGAGTYQCVYVTNSIVMGTVWQSRTDWNPANPGNSSFGNGYQNTGNLTGGASFFQLTDGQWCFGGISISQNFSDCKVSCILQITNAPITIFGKTASESALTTTSTTYAGSYLFLHQVQ